MRVVPHRSLASLWQRRSTLLVLTCCCLLFSLLLSANPRKLTAQPIHPLDPHYPILASCAGSDEQDLFQVSDAELGFDFSAPRAGDGVRYTPDVIDIWSDRYHTRVNAVLEAYFSENTPNCLARSMGQFLVPPAELRSLAQQLPPWEDPTDLMQLTRQDMGPVLLEYLRTYECALTERDFFLPSDVVTDLFAIHDIFGLNPVRWQDWYDEYLDQQIKIAHEIATSRLTLHRAIGFALGTDRLYPLEAEVECFQRASLDIRNAFALAAEAASCLPRVWDVKDPLRDYDQRQ